MFLLMESSKLSITEADFEDSIVVRHSIKILSQRVTLLRFCRSASLYYDSVAARHSITIPS
jgi:hypothetical protein